MVLVSTSAKSLYVKWRQFLVMVIIHMVEGDVMDDNSIRTYEISYHCGIDIRIGTELKGGIMIISVLEPIMDAS